MKYGIVSGYFNPLHAGHLDMIEDAKKRFDAVIVIVNNDKQQLLKKGKIIMEEKERLRIVEALSAVHSAVIASDEDGTVCDSLAKIASARNDMLPKYKGHSINLYFCNGGDRKSVKDIPETKTCEENDIEMVFEVGTNVKANSSTEINEARGAE